MLLLLHVCMYACMANTVILHVHTGGRGLSGIVYSYLSSPDRVVHNNTYNTYIYTFMVTFIQSLFSSCSYKVLVAIL